MAQSKNTKANRGKPTAEIKKARDGYRFNLLANPNYHGSYSGLSLPESKLKVVSKLLSNTTYESLCGVGYNPDTKELRAVVTLGQPSGYSGKLCVGGSREYVRFYVDYARDGNWTDEGVVSFAAHDLGFSEDLCYGVVRPIDAPKNACCDDPAILPKVRAILSWNVEPPAGQPNWTPSWGDVREVDIQLEPLGGILGLFCQLDFQFPFEKLAELKALEPKFIDPGPKKLQAVSIAQLKNRYAKAVPDTRLGYQIFKQSSLKLSGLELSTQAATLAAAKIDIAKLVEFVSKPNFNTGYEELTCVGLNRALDVLHATLHVKRASGYGGDLCETGTKEYVAFYMDFGTGWQHMGTNSVGVHDIPTITNDGLWYNVPLPVGLSEHQKRACQAGNAKVRAILSWNAVPPPNDPDWVAPWGDWAECHVEIKPLPGGVVIPDEEPYPIIESIGGMQVSAIDAGGYANGPSDVVPNLAAVDSPFDGIINVNGTIVNSSNSYNPTGTPEAKVRYRLMVKAPDAGTAQPVLRQFSLLVTTYYGGSHSSVSQTIVPDANGWIEYLPDVTAPGIVMTEPKKLAEFVPSVAGLHELHIEVEGLPMPSLVKKVMVDKTAPEVDVEITSGGGNCGVFSPGDQMTGTYSISDDHCYSVSLSITPAVPAKGPGLEMDGGTASRSYLGDLPTTGDNGTWTLDTQHMLPCGYNIRIHGSDRTIVHSKHFGHQKWDIEGFCLLSDEDGV